MFAKQLPPGYPAPPPRPAAPARRTIFTARPANADNIIDAEVLPPAPGAPRPHARPAFTEYDPYGPPPAPRLRDEPPPRGASRLHDDYRQMHSPYADEEADAFPDQFARAYYSERENQRRTLWPWAIIFTPIEPNLFKITIYGSRWMLTVVFIALVLIGFSIEKVPHILPQLLEFLP